MKEKGDLEMSILKEFDEAIAEKESKRNGVGRGYVIEGKDPYMAYMDKEAWDLFLKQMRSEHFNQYYAGSGKELVEKDGKPPKMASFASSSQMICRLSRDIEGFVFEEQLPTTVGGLANLDGYLQCADKHIFVEAKCREPYGHAGSQSISSKYEKLYLHLEGENKDRFRCEIKKEKDDAKNMEVCFFWKDRRVEYFDIKQMICHMLGIASKLLKYPDNKSVLFLYLLYNPSDLDMSDAAKEETLRIYEDTCWAAQNIDFEALFAKIVDYLVIEKGLRASDETIRHMKSLFKFKLCDQNTYKTLLK